MLARFLLLGVPDTNRPRFYHGCAAAAWVSLVLAAIWIVVGLALGYSLDLFSS